MPKFSILSNYRLSSCHIDLQNLFNEVVKKYDCTITKGHRNQKDQNDAYNSGRSKLKWPDGNHNKIPSWAIDVYPYPIRLPLDTDSEIIKQKKLRRFYHFAGYVLRTAHEMGFNIRWGGDWDGDYIFSDQTFDDLVHFERS